MASDRDLRGGRGVPDWTPLGAGSGVCGWPGTWSPIGIHCPVPSRAPPSGPQPQMCQICSSPSPTRPAQAPGVSAVEPTLLSSSLAPSRPVVLRCTALGNPPTAVPTAEKARGLAGGAAHEWGKETLWEAHGVPGSWVGQHLDRREGRPRASFSPQRFAPRLGLASSAPLWQGICTHLAPPPAPPSAGRWHQPPHWPPG